MRPSGPTPTRVAIVGEAPGSEEIRAGVPFVGYSGRLLDQMLHEVGLLRTECFVTNVCNERPPNNDMGEWVAVTKGKPRDHPDWVRVGDKWLHPSIPPGIELLHAHLAECRPEVIIACGNLALWALTGNWGIKKWRGSRLSYEDSIVIPIYHPAAILREYDLRPITVQDLRRAAAARPSDRAPETNFLVRPSFDQVVSWLAGLKADLDLAPTKLAVDLETRAGEAACIGLAATKDVAICIPFLCVERVAGYWTEEQELAIIRLLKVVLEHPNAQVVGQNFLYDVQYTFKQWRCIPTVVRDTMGAEHALFAGYPKGLDYLSSKWCKWHVYWKDESKNWDPEVGEDQLWVYNCKDAIVTFEVDEEQQRAVDSMGLREVHDRHQAKFWLALDIMLRGTRRDAKLCAQFAGTLIEELSAREAWLYTALGHEINPQSPLQLKRLFYEDLQQPVVFSRKTKAPTTDDDALTLIAKREPLMQPICRRIAEHRSLNVFLSTFVNARPSWDGRIRTQFNPFGPETYRASSSRDAFDSGMNMQNIPVGKEDALGSDLRLPNIRKLFVPDQGYELCEIDLDRADLQVVVWEADDAGLKSMLRKGLDVHLYTARDIFGLKYTDEEIIEGTEACDENKRRYKQQRQKAKAGVHATNYAVQERTLSSTLGITQAEAGRFIAAWLSAHPGIRKWHDRTRHEVAGRRFVQNKFGYRRYYLGRTDDVLPEALAWTPQSTVAEVINTIWKRIAVHLPEVQMLIQVHDSLLFQYPIGARERLRGAVRDLARSVVVPYDDPLNIPIGFKFSTTSWGDAK